jgi:hypothetical protein
LRSKSNNARTAPLVEPAYQRSIPALARKCSELLKAMFDEQSCLFAYSTTIKDGGYINDFSHRAVYRYTINSLAGIQRAKMFQQLDWDVDRIIDGFLALHWSAVRNAADNGLLLYVLAVAGHTETQSQLKRIERVIDDEKRLIELDLQEICWILAGLTKCTERTGKERAAVAAKRCGTILRNHYFNSDTFLPFHNLSRYRFGFTSFGGIAYFLWSVYHYARVFGDRQARSTFEQSVRRVMALQGSRGEWPWFVDASNETVLDWYQLFSVHQDSMAPLFLLPALDSGIGEARTAIENSYRWIFGNNELQALMILDNPFFIYRSIRRKAKFERERRYMRALASRALGMRAEKAPVKCLEINRECRSYHIGWLLFAWAGRKAFEEFSELRLLK